MAQILIVPSVLLRPLLSDLRQAPHATAWCRVGRYAIGADTGWLLRYPLRGVPRLREAATAPAPVWQCRLVTQSAALLEVSSVPRRPGVVGNLLIGDGPLRGALWGTVRTEHGEMPLERVHLAGPGMHRLALPLPQSGIERPTRRAAAPLARPQARTDASAMWSRTIGALGGEAVWQRLISLRLGVIGVGRTGSLVAAALARLGVQDVSLIDPDVVEPHNLGEMACAGPDDLNRPKVEAVADALRRITGVTYTALPVPVTAETARRACLRADVLLCCVDNDAARLATALLATLYHKVLLDLGTGITFAEPSPDPQRLRNRTMGADVRLIIPGAGCLLCHGGLADFTRAVEDLTQPRPINRQQPWHVQRAGSLRTLNQLAAAVGVQLLQDLVAERVQTSTWAQLTINGGGRLAVQYPALPATNSCTLCARAGLGDAGLGWSA